MANAINPAPRPSSVTVVSAILAFVAVAGFGNAAVWNQSELISAAARYGFAVGGALHTSIALIGAVAALATSVGLWRMASWARPAFMFWSLSVVAYGAWLLYSGLFRWAGTATIVLLLVVPIVFLAAIYRFLAKTLRWSVRSNNRWRGP